MKADIQKELFGAIELLCHDEYTFALTGHERLLAISYLANQLSRGLNINDSDIVEEVAEIAKGKTKWVSVGISNALRHEIKEHPNDSI